MGTKQWVKKSRKYLLTIYPEYNNLIINSKEDDYLVYLLILLNDFNKINKLELYPDELLELRLLILIKIMNILYTRVINIMLENIKENKIQKYMRVILDRINGLKEEVIKKKEGDKNLKEEILIIISKIHNLIKIKLINFNITEEIKDLILEYY